MSQSPLPRLCFWADRKTKMAVPNSDWFRYFRLFLWNHWTQFFQVYCKQDLNVLYKVCAFWVNRITKMATWPLICWDIFYFSSEIAEQNSTKLNRKQDRTVLYKVCVLEPIRKPRLLYRTPMAWDIFYFSPETAERFKKKLHKKPDLNVLYRVCVFMNDWKTKMFVPVSDKPTHLRLIICNCWTEFKETWQKARY